MIRAQQNVQFQKKNSWQIIGNSEAVGGISKAKKFKGKYEANGNFWRVGGGSNKKNPFPGEGMNIFWN